MRMNNHVVSRLREPPTNRRADGAAAAGHERALQARTALAPCITTVARPVTMVSPALSMLN